MPHNSARDLLHEFPILGNAAAAADILLEKGGKVKAHISNNGNSCDFGEIKMEKCTWGQDETALGVEQQ